MELNRKLLRKPIVISLWFSAATYLLFIFGSYSYPEINRTKLFIFLLVTNLAMFTGFCFGTKTKSRQPGHVRFPIETTISVLFWISLLVCIPKFAIYTGNLDLDFSEIIYNIRHFFTSSQEIYSARQNLKSVSGVWRYINYGLVLAGPLYWAYTPLAMFYWRKLKLSKKIGTLFIWMIYLLQYMCTGTNVGFFDFFITLGVVILIKGATRSASASLKTKISRKQKRTMMIILILIVLLLVLIFSTTMGDRIGSAYKKTSPIGPYTAPFNYNSPVNKLLPGSLEPLAAFLTRYLAQPYNALAMALDLPFDSTWGLGNSWFVMDNLGSFSATIWERTYNIKLEQNYNFDHYGNWHTAYLWFANDVSFIGVPLLFFILFAVFGKMWKEFLETKSIFAFLFFMLFVKLVYFISANNQVFMNSDTLLAFWGLVLLYILFRHYYWEEARYGI